MPAGGGNVSYKPPIKIKKKIISKQQQKKCLHVRNSTWHKKVNLCGQICRFNYFLFSVLEYKFIKTQDDVDWEPCQSKYVDILADYLSQFY